LKNTKLLLFSKYYVFQKEKLRKKGRDIVNHSVPIPNKLGIQIWVEHSPVPAAVEEEPLISLSL